MENNYQEISIIQLFKVAFGNWVRIFIITGVIAIVGILFIHFYYDPAKTEYVADFNYFVQGLDNGLYIDGSAFNYQELVSYDALAAAKASSLDFDDIDIEKMYHTNNISVDHVRDKDNKNEETYLYYSIRVKSKFFSDSEQAKAFISYLAEAPIEKTICLSDASKYKYNLKVFNDCESFDTQLNYLGEQLNLLDGKYDKLIAYYGDITLQDQDTITDKKKAMDLYFVNNSLLFLRYEKEENGYVLDKGSNIENLKLKKLDLEKQYKYNEMELDKIENSIYALMENVGAGVQTAEIDSYNSRITELISQNVGIVRQIDDINLQLENVENSKNKEYGEKLYNCSILLNDYTDRYQKVEYEVINDNSKVFYNNASIIEGQGGLGLIKGGILSVAFGGFVACCVNLMKGWRDIFKDPFEEDEEKREKQIQKNKQIWDMG